MVVCLTGSIYAFKNQIEDLFYNVDIITQGTSINLDKSIKHYRLNFDEPTKIWVPEQYNQALEITSASKQSIGNHVYYHPETGEIISQRNKKLTRFFAVVLEIHRWLLVEKPGKMIVGTSILLFVYLIISGIIMWIPKKLKYVKQGLLIKSKAKFYRLNYDLHKILGFYSALLLLVIAVTGLYVSFHWVKNAAIVSFGGPSITLRDSELGKSQLSKNISSSFNDLYSDLISENEQVNERETIGSLYSIVDQQFKSNGKIVIQYPFSEGGYYSFKKFKTGFWSQSIYDEILINKYGVIKEEKYFDELPVYKKFMIIVKPLHTGEIFGAFSAILYFIVSLIAFSLPITGFFIWRKRAFK